MTRVATEDEVTRILARLGVAAAPPSPELLGELQRAWSLGEPFHNLDLLAGYATGAPPLDRRGGWLRCVEGLGGPCHVQASSFLALLTALGFDAHFAAATITHPGDHLVVCTHFGERAWLSDVGNGHPYLRPFSFDGPVEQAHLGWAVRSEPTEHGLVLHQLTPGADAWRRVYVATRQRRGWADFEGAIRRHHTERGFGPFLTGLRAVRVGADVAYTLRDDVFTTHRIEGSSTRVLRSGHEELLGSTMDMGRLPVVDAVSVWRRNSGRTR